MALIDDIRALLGDHDSLLIDLFDQLDKSIAKAQGTLFNELALHLLDNLDIEGGVIKNTARNRAVLNSIDRVFNEFETGANLDVAKEMVSGVSKIIDFNTHYFTNFSSQSKLKPISDRVKTSAQAWLGIGPRGKLEENGYLKTIVTDKSIRNQVKNMTIQSVVTQQGFFSLKKGLADFIQGKKEAGKERSLGSLQKYYRNYAYDTYSVMDAAVAKEFADRLDMKYAIYEGGLIATSREFCKKRNGKVFTTDEIAAFNPTEARQPNYNPFRDRGGYGCRHHYNYITYELATLLRPDLKKAS